MLSPYLPYQTHYTLSGAALLCTAQNLTTTSHGQSFEGYLFTGLIRCNDDLICSRAVQLNMARDAQGETLGHTGRDTSLASSFELTTGFKQLSPLTFLDDQLECIRAVGECPWDQETDANAELHDRRVLRGVVNIPAATDEVEFAVDSLGEVPQDHEVDPYRISW